MQLKSVVAFLKKRKHVIIEQYIILDFRLFYRSSNFLKPGEMKPPYSSMSRSTSSNMRSSHSSHHRPTHKPNLAISNVKNLNRFTQPHVLSYMRCGSSLLAYLTTSQQILKYKFLFLQSHNSNDTNTPSTIEDILNVSNCVLCNIILLSIYVIQYHLT